MFTKMATILALMATINGTPVENHSVYVRTMEIVELNYETDVVTCIDPVGFQWDFYGCEDYYEGDIVSCLMDTMGTEESIMDDYILDVWYTGYWVD